MIPVVTSPKDSSDTEVSYLIDWEAYLGGDTIASIVSVEETAGDGAITVESYTSTTTTTTVYLSGGTANVNYTITVTITLSSSAQVRQRSFVVKVREL